RVGQMRAVDVDEPLNEIAAPSVPRIGGARQVFRAGRRRSARSGRLQAEKMERELRRGAQQALQAVRILHPRKLDHDAVRSLPGDLRLVHPGLVDATADDL